MRWPRSRSHCKDRRQGGQTQHYDQAFIPICICLSPITESGLPILSTLVTQRVSPSTTRFVVSLIASQPTNTSRIARHPPSSALLLQFLEKTPSTAFHSYLEAHPDALTFEVWLSSSSTTTRRAWHSEILMQSTFTYHPSSYSPLPVPHLRPVGEPDTAHFRRGAGVCQDAHKAVDEALLAVVRP